MGDNGESGSLSTSGGGGEVSGCTKTRGLGGTIHKGEDVNPALPGKRGTVAGTGGAAGVSTVSTVSTGVSVSVWGGGGGAGGRGIKGAEVNPHGFLLIIGATGTKRGGASVVAVAS